MGDFPSQWKWVKDLKEGGQGHTFVVKRADKSDLNQYALKRGRTGYYQREVQACTTLDHPNLLKLIDHGYTPGNKPFLVTEYCQGGSLEDGLPSFTTPNPGLRFFRQIVAGIAYAHTQATPVYHLDIKPANIFLKDGRPVVGDFGICFIDDNQQTLTHEGPHGSIYYCAPELRERKIENGLKYAASDIYSLGKVLYWLFTKEIHDGHEDDYSNNPQRRLARLFLSHPQFAFVDELISVMVQRKAENRIQSADDLDCRIQGVIDRIEAGGRVLDLRVAQRCLYCGEGRYQPA